MLDAARAPGADALARTPELLPVLAEAGVVDAGGAGLLLLLDAALRVVDGRPLPEPEAADGRARRGLAAALAAAHAERRAAHGDGGVADLRYEVMYFLEAPDETIPAFKDVWAGIGDSIVVVGGDGIWNCHIHTDDIGAAIEAAIDCGRPRDIRVTDLLEQVEEERWVREAAPDRARRRARTTPVETAVVAVATGDGIRRIFHSLGVQRIVTGGQTMNPSTAQLLEAVESAPADQVVILPNNKNIIPVAEQVDAQTDKTVHVVPTRGVAEGFASLLAYDPEADGLDNAKAMAEAAAAVVAGEVTRAVRDSDLRPGRRSTRATTSASPATASGRWPAASTWSCTQLLDVLVDRRARDRHGHRGRGGVGRRHPPHHGVARRAPPRRRPSRSTTAASRCTRTSSASSRPGPGMARTLQALDEVSAGRTEAWPVDSPNSPRSRSPSSRASARRAPRRWPSSTSQTVLDLLTYYPRRYLDRTNERRIDELDVGEEAMVLVTVKAVARHADPVAQGDGHRRRHRRLGLPARSPSSTSPGGSASSSRAPRRCCSARSSCSAAAGR